MTIRFNNSLSHRLQDFQPLQDGQAGLYTCGPTVYNFAHIGNFRAYVFEDLLKRTLLFNGLSVKHVMNLTDVDDKTIKGSQAAHIPLQDFTQTYKDAFFSDIKTLRLIPADVYPAATAHIPEMIALIQKLFELGIAYQAEDKSVYFSLAKWPRYGQLVHIERDQMLTGARFSMDEYTKESVCDFALWKAWDEKVKDHIALFGFYFPLSIKEQDKHADDPPDTDAGAVVVWDGVVGEGATRPPAGAGVRNRRLVGTQGGLACERRCSRNAVEPVDHRG